MSKATLSFGKMKTKELQYKVSIPNPYKVWGYKPQLPPIHPFQVLPSSPQISKSVYKNQQKSHPGLHTRVHTNIHTVPGHPQMRIFQVSPLSLTVPNLAYARSQHPTRSSMTPLTQGLTSIVAVGGTICPYVLAYVPFQRRHWSSFSSHMRGLVWPHTTS